MDDYQIFLPRPDDPANGDEQTAFFNSKHPGVTFLLGGNGAGCLGAEQHVYDPVAKKSRRVSEIDSPFHVLARNEAGQPVIALATRPRIYGVEDLYAVTLAAGATIVVTLGHRVLTSNGWREIGDIARDVGLLPSQTSDDVLRCRGESDAGTPIEGRIPATPQSARVTDHPDATISEDRQAKQTTDQTFPSEQAAHADSPSAGRETIAPFESRKCAFRSSHTPSGSTDRCSTDHHPCDAQLRSVSDIAQDAFQQSVGVLERSRLTPPSGDLVDRPVCNHACRSGGHHSTIRCVHREHRGREGGCVSSEPCSRFSDAAGTRHLFSRASTPAIHPTRDGRQFPAGTCQTDTTQSSVAVATASRVDESFCDLSAETECDAAHITAIRFLRRDYYWDFSVEEHENYWMDGCWHHNTTETALSKVATFVLHDQPPPRKDTPFWIIAGSYEQTMLACWKEKLSGHNRIPSSEVDWARVKWYREKDGMPYRVPLKPWPGRPGCNWSLEFKSYEQGRQQMQARSIGGFLFVEQFPWGLLEEVLRGCREYAFLGNKLAEFTPIDPLMSEPLETMLVEDKLPPGWAVYYANTECAKNAGHVTQQWFDEFFGMISPEMRDVRMKGAFGAYEGVIYQGFNPKVHCIDEAEFPEGVFHRRSLDWGSGPENAFVCLWAYRTGSGQWVVYDEYYSTNQLYTVHDHLKEICERWPWPENNPHYGTTYADPSDPGNIRIASRFGEYCPGFPDLNMSPAKNSVFEGIEHVRYMLKTAPGLNAPRVVIVKPQCPNLVRQMKTYRWEKSSDRGLNPRDARPVPLKREDHAVDALRYLLYSEASGSGYTIGNVKRRPDVARHGVQLARKS